MLHSVPSVTTVQTSTTSLQDLWRFSINAKHHFDTSIFVVGNVVMMNGLRGHEKVPLVAGWGPRC